MHLHSTGIAKNEVDSNNVKFVQNIRKMDRILFSLEKAHSSQGIHALVGSANIF